MACSLLIVSLLIFVVPERTQAQTVNIDYVAVGDAGNAGDTTYGESFGAVGYGYSIGKYDVTDSQYTAFLNAVDPNGTNSLALWDSTMSSNANGGINFNAGAASGTKFSIKTGYDQIPVVFVTFYSALRFVNWLNNGQGNGSTETGAYTLLGGTPTPSNGNTITRNAGAKVFFAERERMVQGGLLPRQRDLYQVRNRIKHPPHKHRAEWN